MEFKINQKAKKMMATGLAAALLTTALPLYGASAAESGTIESSVSANDATNAQNEQLVNELSKYVEKQPDGQVYLNKDFKKEVAISEEDAQKLENHINLINESVRNGDLVVNDDLSVDIVGNPSGVLSEYGINSATAAASGTSYTISVWGVTVFMDNNAAVEFAQTLISNGGAVVGASVISRFIPTPPTVLVSTIAGVIGGGGVAAGKRIEQYNKGKGVRLEFKLPAGFYVYTRY
ncbi:hypothetical protein [Saccharibacillus sacchari]|uniref:Uncharacterized protein n=1 Tax=Saccharibacillus sacchari TaxID=456493 RepID=A0ACC6P8U8_9BACL